MATLLNIRPHPFTAYPNHKEKKMADTKIVVNCETGEIAEIELTEDEIQERKANAAAYAKAKADEDKAAAQKAALKSSVAERLGITADELAALIS